MPYIKKEQREELEPELGALIQKMLSMPEFHSTGRAGILNYVITAMLDSCFGPLSDAKYKDYNEAIGMLECCKLEFYRKAAAPYEDMKEKQNGKVLDGENVRLGLAGKDLTRQQLIPANLFEHGLKQSDKTVGTFSEKFKLMRELVYPVDNLSTSEFDCYAVFKLAINKNLSLFILGSSREDAEEIMNKWLKCQYTLNRNSVPLSYVELGDLTGYFNFYKNFCDLERKIKDVFLVGENNGIPKIILFSKNKKKLQRNGIK